MIDQKQYQQVMAKCVRDQAFKQHLLADPRETLRREGVELPTGVTVKVTENTPDVINLVIPAGPIDWGEEMSVSQTWGTLDSPRPSNPFFWDGD
jgi:hypothetical protein